MPAAEAHHLMAIDLLLSVPVLIDVISKITDSFKDFKVTGRTFKACLVDAAALSEIIGHFTQHMTPPTTWSGSTALNMSPAFRRSARYFCRDSRSLSLYRGVRGPGSHLANDLLPASGYNVCRVPFDSSPPNRSPVPRKSTCGTMLASSSGPLVEYQTSVPHGIRRTS